MAVAHRRLRHLRQQRLGVTQQQTLHRAGAIELVLQQRPLQPVGVTGALHNGPAGRGLAAHEEGDADDSLVTDHGDFGRCAVLHDVEQGHDRGGGEIDVAHPNAGLVKHLTERHRDPFQMREEACVFVRRQGGEKMILAGVRRDRHGRSPNHRPRSNRLADVAEPHVRGVSIVEVYDSAQTHAGIVRFVGMVAQRSEGGRFVLATVARAVRARMET